MRSGSPASFVQQQQPPQNGAYGPPGSFGGHSRQTSMNQQYAQQPQHVSPAAFSSAPSPAYSQGGVPQSPYSAPVATPRNFSGAASPAPSAASPAPALPAAKVKKPPRETKKAKAEREAAEKARAAAEAEASKVAQQQALQAQQTAAANTVRANGMGLGALS